SGARGFDSGENQLADQNHSLVGTAELFFAAIELRLGRLAGDVFGAHAAAKRRQRALVVGLLLGRRFDAPAGREFGKKLGIGAGVMIDGVKRKAVIVIGCD